MTMNNLYKLADNLASFVVWLVVVTAGIGFSLILLEAAHSMSLDNDIKQIKVDIWNATDSCQTKIKEGVNF